MKHEVIILDDDNYDPNDELAPEYDVDALRQAAKEAGFDTRSRIVRIASDVAAFFPDEDAVNAALREFIATKKRQVVSQTQVAFQ